MPARYQGPGYSLLYPETWTVEEDEKTEALTLESPTGAFLTITASRDLEEAYRETMRMMESEYEEVEHEELMLELAGHSLHGVRSEEHTSEHQSPTSISYDVFCLKN